MLAKIINKDLEEFEREFKVRRMNYDQVVVNYPSDIGLKVFDKKDVEYIKLLDGLIAVQLNEGNHVIEFKYKTPGLTAGISISIVTFIIVIIREVFKKYRFTKNNSLKIS